MESLNTCTLIGRLGADAIKKDLQGGGKVTSFNLATTESYKQQDGTYKDETQWHNVNAWGNSADYASTLKKGDLVCVQGMIKYRKYVDKDGVEKYITDIQASNIKLFKRHTAGTTSAPASAGQQQQQQRQAPAASADVSDDLPF